MQKSKSKASRAVDKQNSKIQVKQNKEEKSRGLLISNNTSYLFLFLICVITFLLYYKTLNYWLIYNWDDAGYILKNEYIKELSWKNIKRIFSEYYFFNYHPITTLSYAIEYYFTGEEKAGLYHFTNVLFHIFNTILVYLLTKKLFFDRNLPALFVAALFALHPMHVESVAWVSERKDVLYSFFYLLSLNAYLKFLKTNKSKFYILTFVYFLLSCLSKSAAITLPVLLFAIDWYYDKIYQTSVENKKFTLKNSLYKVPLLIVSIIFGIIAIYSQDTAIKDLTPVLTPIERAAIIMHSFLTYLYKSIFPVNLSAYYPYPTKVNNAIPTYYYLSIIPVVILAILFIWFRKKIHTILFGFAFFLITISLVLQIIPVGGAVLAERYTYIPYLGFFIIFVSPINWLYENVNKKKQNFAKLTITLLCVFLVWYSYATNERIKLWEDGEKLFTDVIKKNPDFAFAYNNRGFLYFDYYALKKYKDNPELKQKYVDLAYNDYTKAIRLNPQYPQAYANRAVLLYNTGRPEEALKDFDVLLKIKPDHTDGLIGRANTLSTLEKFKEAIPDYNNYIKIKKDEDYKAYTWRGIAYFKTEKYDSAIVDFTKAHKLNPSDYEPIYWLGLTYFQLNDYQNSIEFLTKSLQINPNKFEAYSYRGLAYYNTKQYHKAIEDFDKSIKLKPTEYANYVNRSLAYYELQNYEQAFKDLIYAAEHRHPISKPYFEKLYAKVKKK